MPTHYKARPRPSRVKAAVDRALPIAQTFLMISAAMIFVLLLAKINVLATTAAIEGGRPPIVTTYLP